MTTLVGLVLAVVLLLVPGRPLATDFKQDAAQIPDDNKPNPDLGRWEVTVDDADRGAFKTPMLRDVARRGPYMHDGSQRTLADVVAYYDRGGVKNPWLSTDMKPLGLTAHEQDELVEFMKAALSGEIDPEVSRPPVLPK